MIENYINNFSCTLTASVGLMSSTIVVSTAASVVSGFRVLIGTELMLVIAGGTSITWTVTRAVESTVLATHNIGDVVSVVLTAGALDNLRAQWSGVGTYVNLPTSGMKVGDRYRCTDSPYEFVYDGASWKAFYRSLGPCTVPPTVSNLTWNNQGGATATSTTGELVISCPALAGTDALRSLWKAYPVATPFTFTLGYMMNGPTQNYYRTGIVVSDGTKLVTFTTLMNLSFTGCIGFEYGQWANSTSINYQTFPYAGFDATATPIFMSVNDTGTNLVCYMSNDPYNLTQTQVYSISRTNYLTPAYIGVIVDCNSTSQATCGMLTKVFHWSGA